MSLATGWSETVFQVTWQSAAVCAVCLLAAWLLRHRSAPLRHGLLLVALAKFAIPPMLALPFGAFSQIPVARDTVPAQTAIIAPALATAPAPVAPAAASVALPAVAAPSWHMDWPLCLAALHGAGALVMAVLIGWYWFQLRRLVRKSAPTTDWRLQTRLDALRIQLGVSRRVRLLVTPENGSPMAFGLFRPTILLPESVAEKDPSECVGVLAHELAHIRRKDIVVIWIENALLTAWWFNPVLWHLVRRIRSVREECCDDLVLSYEIADSDAYCDSLLRTAAGLARPGRMKAALAFADRLHPLGTRLRRIMDATVRRRPRLSMPGVVGIVVLGLAVLPGLRAVVHAADFLKPARATAEPMRLIVADQDGRAIVNPTRQWSDTGLTVTAGQKLAFKATGQVRGAMDSGNWAAGPFDPDGVDHQGKQALALVGRIQAERDSQEFPIGKEKALDAPLAGRLYIGVADDTHADNDGAFTVAVSVDGKPVDFRQITASAKPVEMPREVVAAAQPPEVNDAAGKLICEATYSHKSRGYDRAETSTVWVKQRDDGSRTVTVSMTGMGLVTIAADPRNKMVQYKSTSDDKKYLLQLDMKAGQLLMTRHGLREDKDNVPISVPDGAQFDPNSRPDTYAAAFVLARQWDMPQGQSREFEMYDMDNAGESFVPYRVKVENAGQEDVKLAAGDFKCTHYVLTQLTSADTWFKKRAGHVTDFWIDENGLPIHILRHREPYEMTLYDLKTAGKK